MCQFMKNQLCQFVFGQVDEGIEQWVVEIVQCGICRNVGYIYVEVLGVQGVGIGYGGVVVVVFVICYVVYDEEILFFEFD